MATDVFSRRSVCVAALHTVCRLLLQRETWCFLTGSIEDGSGAVNRNGDEKQFVGDSEMDRPRWMNDELVEKTIRQFQPKSSEPFGEDEAVKVLLSLSQLLEATGLLKLEIDDDEEVHRMGESEQS